MRPATPCFSDLMASASVCRCGSLQQVNVLRHHDISETQSEKLPLTRFQRGLEDALGHGRSEQATMAVTRERHEVGL